MCVVSNVGDDYSKRFPATFPGTPWLPAPAPNWPTVPPTTFISVISRQEFDELKAMVVQMKRDLEAAKAQDVADGNPDCEMEEKVALLKQIAKFVGVDLTAIFADHK